MLEVKQIVKTFFKGTVNEKVALHGVDLRLESVILLPLSAAMGPVKVPY